MQDSSRRSTQRALHRELSLRGIRATAEAPFSVIYKGHSVGEYFADLPVEDALVVELKCAEHLASEHTAQCLNYLRSRTVCILVNFQKPKVEWKRGVLGFADEFGARSPGIAQIVCPFISWTLHKSQRCAVGARAPPVRAALRLIPARPVHRAACRQN